MAASKSINNGSSWTRYHLTTTTGFAYTLEIDPNNSNIVYVGGDGGIYKTTNAGTSWSGASTGITGIVYDMAINPENTSTLYAATANGIYRTTNSGTSWAYSGCSSANAVIIDPSDPNTIYAGTSSGVYKSTNSGTSWAVMNDGLDDTYITCLSIYPSYYLFAGTESAGMYRWDLNIGINEFITEQYADNISLLPNPTTGKTTITYQLMQTTDVEICIYDIQGRLINSLVKSRQTAGPHKAIWYGLDNSGNAVTPGIYLCKISTDHGSYLEKLILIR